MSLYPIIVEEKLQTARKETKEIFKNKVKLSSQRQVSFVVNNRSNSRLISERNFIILTYHWQ